MTVIRVVKGEIIDHSNNDHTIQVVKKGKSYMKLIDCLNKILDLFDQTYPCAIVSIATGEIICPLESPLKIITHVNHHLNVVKTSKGHRCVFDFDREAIIIYIE